MAFLFDENFRVIDSSEGVRPFGRRMSKLEVVETKIIIIREKLVLVVHKECVFGKERGGGVGGGHGYRSGSGGRHG